MKESVGQPLNRVDGRLKVTGRATYSAEYQVPNLAHAVLLTSTVSSGRIGAIETRAAERFPGVLAVMTYKNTPKLPTPGSSACFRTTGSTTTTNRSESSSPRLSNPRWRPPSGCASITPNSRTGSTWMRISPMPTHRLKPAPEAILPIPTAAMQHPHSRPRRPASSTSIRRLSKRTTRWSLTQRLPSGKVQTN